jgi:hypothetical protein
MKDDGTSGCIALTNRNDLDEVLNYIQTYQPKFLNVQISIINYLLPIKLECLPIHLL